MKQLIVGIDGADNNIFKRLPMPFLNNLLSNELLVKVTNDLCSRGWVEIISGEHACETRGLYIAPLLDGSHKFQLKYNLNDLQSVENIIPIWRIPESRGRSVGIMNIPTTYPAPKVNGFFVSGAGGGVNKVDGIPFDLCYPQHLSEILQSLNYKIDLRVGTAGISDIDELFRQLMHMLEYRTEAFIRLCKKYKPDFSFIAFRASVVIEYLAMSEIQYYFSFIDGTLPEGVEEKHRTWFKNIPLLYQLLDECVRRIFENLSPENWMIVSDHGMVPWKYNANANAFLQRQGYQHLKTSIADRLKNSFRSFSGVPDFKKGNCWWSKTQAFGHWYLNGIYINDDKRFHGPVTQKEIYDLVNKICDDFNSSAEAHYCEICASPYRRKFHASRFEEYLPDIHIEGPGTTWFLSREGYKPQDLSNFFKINLKNSSLYNLSNVTGGMHSGQKGNQPIFCCNKELGNFIDYKDNLNLTLTYKISKRLFETN